MPTFITNINRVSDMKQFFLVFVETPRGDQLMEDLRLQEFPLEDMRKLIGQCSYWWTLQMRWRGMNGTFKAWRVSTWEDGDALVDILRYVGISENGRWFNSFPLSQEWLTRLNLNS